MTPEKSQETWFQEVVKIIGGIVAIGSIFGMVGVLRFPANLILPIGVIVIGLAVTIVLVRRGKLDPNMALIIWLGGIVMWLVILYLNVSRPATIVGSFVDRDKNPIGNLEFVLTNHGGVLHHMRTDKNGGFEIRNIPEGEFTISVGGQPLISRRVPSGWKRMFNPVVDVGNLSYTLGTSPTPTPTDTPSPSPSPTLTGTATHTPTPSPAATPNIPSPYTPPEGLSGKIAYPVYKDGRKYIFIAYLGTGVKSDLFKEDASEPAISPNGSKIAYRSWNASTLGLMVRNIDGTESQRVSRGIEDACPCWALGESLVFHSTKKGPTPRLYVAGTWVGANGTNNVQDVMRGPDPAYGRYPAWVPDGRFVYEYFERSGDFRGLWIQNQDGSNPVPITDHPGDTMPSVSPGGDKVAFMSDRTGKWEVYVVNIDGSGLRQLTHSRGYNSGLPTWSPDGNHIAFVSDYDNQWAIWVVNYDGSGERKLFDLGSPLEWWERISWAP